MHPRRSMHRFVISLILRAFCIRFVWEGIMKLNLRRSISIALVLLIVLGIPLGLVAYQSHRTGMTWWQVVQRMLANVEAPSTGTSSEADGPSAALPDGEKIDFLHPEPIGYPFDEPPRISHARAVDLDSDGLLDVVVCDCQKDLVSWIRQHPAGVFNESVCADGLVAPAHVEAVDFDHDGDLDLIVAVLGMLFPNNDRIGSVVILENSGQMKFVKHVIIQNVARVSDVRAGDLDSDGDMDLAVAQFGYDDGETRWLENLGGWKFKSHLLQSLSGPIHCEIADLNLDGNLDIVVLVSQEWEQVYAFLGDGKGNFQPQCLFGSDNQDYGSSGLWLYDFDQDDDVDVIFTNGDAFDYLPPVPRAWHGVQWLENRPNMDFKYHRLADFGGAVGAKPADVDHDGDLDLFVVSAYNSWDRPRAQSMIWLENNGKMQFRRRNITNTPTHIQALDLGDFDGDGEIDLITGGMHTYGPYDRVERIVLWRNKWPEAQKPGAP